MNILSELTTPASESYPILRRLIWGYFLALCVIAPFNLLAFDSYYYWDWSRHLDLSYYDGPPLIAYLIRVMRFFASNSLTGLVFIAILFSALTARILYKTASLFLNEKNSYLVTLLWLSSPIVTQDMLIQVTYDTPMTLFWASSLYYAISYLKTESSKTLYGLGISLGFLLLSKYTGIVLIGGLFLFMLSTSHVRLLKNPHFWGAMGLTVLIFSPVLIWNIQHDWISFNYQMHTHQTQPQHHRWAVFIETFVTKILPVLNVMLLPPFFILKYRKEALTYQPVRLLMILSLSFLGFYLMLSMMANVRNTWLTQYLLASTLLVGWLSQSFDSQHHTAKITAYLSKYKTILKSFIGINFLISIIFLLNACLHFVPSKNFIYYKLIQQFNNDYPEQPNMVFTSGWLNARTLFFLKNKPLIYTLDCGQDQNAYQLWSQSVQQDISQSRLKSILFVNIFDNKMCLQQYFDHCERQFTPSMLGHELYVYRCGTSPNHLKK